jgi:hypothetical protein
MGGRRRPRFLVLAERRRGQPGNWPKPYFVPSHIAETRNTGGQRRWWPLADCPANFGNKDISSATTAH